MGRIPCWFRKRTHDCRSPVVSGTGPIGPLVGGDPHMREPLMGAVPLCPCMFLLLFINLILGLEGPLP